MSKPADAAEAPVKPAEAEPSKPPPSPSAPSAPRDPADEALYHAADLIRSGRAKNIVFMVGAGISTSAGIPDFRSPKTGLYHNLQKLNLPKPEAVFELGYFQRNPQPFWTLAQEIYPGNHFPTPTHYFFSLLHKQSLLHSILTQNIDTLELLAAVPPAKVIDAHGSFATAHCLKCGREASREFVLRSGVRNGEIVRCEQCKGLVKPDIVFFGEGLPDRFWSAIPSLRECDLLFVIGTSLQVQPFAGMIDRVPSSCPRVLVNREAVGPFMSLGAEDSDDDDMSFHRLIARLQGRESSRKGDKLWLGDADDAIWKLARELGWDKELEEMMEQGRAELKAKFELEEGNQLREQDRRGDVQETSEDAAEVIKGVVEEHDTGEEGHDESGFREESDEERYGEGPEVEVVDEEEDLEELEQEFRVKLGS